MTPKGEQSSSMRSICITFNRSGTKVFGPSEEKAVSTGAGFVPRSVVAGDSLATGDLQNIMP